MIGRIIIFAENNNSPNYLQGVVIDKILVQDDICLNLSVTAYIVKTDLGFLKIIKPDLIQSVI